MPIVLVWSPAEVPPFLLNLFQGTSVISDNGGSNRSIIKPASKARIHNGNISKFNHIAVLKHYRVWSYAP